MRPWQILVSAQPWAGTARCSGVEDPAGAWFTFQKGASKTTDGEGFADVWKMGYFGWKYKGRHADLANTR